MNKRATTAKRATKDLQPRTGNDVKGGAEGKVQVHDITITKVVDKSTPLLF